MSILSKIKDNLEAGIVKHKQDEWFYYTLLKIRKESKTIGFVNTLRGSYGICYLLLKDFNCNPAINYLSFEDVNDYVNLNCEGWKYFSGNHSFPIPSHIESLTPQELFWSMEPRWSGEYGKMRRDLLDYLIKKVRYRVYKARREAKSF